MSSVLALPISHNPYEPKAFTQLSEGVRTFTNIFLTHSVSAPYQQNKDVLVVVEQFRQRIDALGDWPKNWDGQGSDKPKTVSIKNAKDWGSKICEFILHSNYEWRVPFISADEKGNVVLEWWYQDRKLTVDIASENVTFTEIRDADNAPKITMGTLRRGDIPLRLRWLILGE